MLTITLNVDQSMILAEFLKKIVAQADERIEDGDEPEGWAFEWTDRTVRPMLAAYQASTWKTITIDSVQASDISCLAQDIISYRAGPQDQSEREFLAILDLFEGTEGDEE